MASILALVVVSSIFAFIIRCSCALCCKDRIKRKQMARKPSACSTFASHFWVVLTIGLILVGAVFSILGSIYLSRTLSLAASGSLGVIDNTLNYVHKISPIIASLLSDVVSVIGGASDSALNVINVSSLASSGVANGLNSLSSSFRNADASVKQLIEEARSIESMKQQLTGTIQNISQSIIATEIAYGSWMNGSYNFTPSNPVSPDAFNNALSAANNFSATLAAIPDIYTNLESLSKLQLSSYADEIASKTNSLQSTVLSFVSVGLQSFKTNATLSVSAIQKTIGHALESLTVDPKKAYDPFSTQIVDFFENLKRYDTWRNLAMCIVAGIVIITLIWIVLLFSTANPKGAKKVNLVIWPIHLIVQILALIFLVAAFAVGDACSLVFDYSPSPITQGFDQTTQQTVSRVFEFKNECLRSESMIQTAVKLRMVDAQAVNLTRQTEKVVNSLDYSVIYQGFDLMPAISLSEEPSSKISTISDLNVPTVKQESLAAMKLFAGALKSSVTSIISSLVSSQKQVHEDNLLAQISDQINVLNQIVGDAGSIDELVAFSTILNKKETSLSKNMTELKASLSKISAIHNQTISGLRQYSENVTTQVNDIYLKICSFSY